MPTEKQDSDAPQTKGSRLLIEDEWAAASTFCEQLAPGLLLLDDEQDSASTAFQPKRQYGVFLPAHQPVNDQGERIASERDVPIPAYLLPEELDQSTRGPSRQTALETIAAKQAAGQLGRLVIHTFINRSQTPVLGSLTREETVQNGRSEVMSEGHDSEDDGRSSRRKMRSGKQSRDEELEYVPTRRARGTAGGPSGSPRTRVTRASGSGVVKSASDRQTQWS